MSDQILLSKKAAAASLGICVRMLEKLMRRGEIEPVRIGDRVLFLRDTLESFARTRRAGNRTGGVRAISFLN